MGYFIICSPYSKSSLIIKQILLCSPAMDANWVLTAGSHEKQKAPPSTHSFTEILTDLQRSKISIQDWSLSDLTVGLYLIYLSQASAEKVDDFKGIQIFSDAMVIFCSLVLITLVNLYYHSIFFLLIKLLPHLGIYLGFYKWLGFLYFNCVYIFNLD